MNKRNRALLVVAALSMTVCSSAFLITSFLPAGAEKHETQKVDGQKSDTRPAVEVMVLEQKALQTGPMNMTIGKQAVKFSLDKLGIVWLASGPKWQSYCYNPEGKTILVRDHATWKSGFFDMRGHKAGRKEPDLKLKETGVREKVAGFKCRKADLICTPAPPYRPGEPHTPYKSGVVWIAEKFPAPSEFSEVMKNLVKVDVKDGVVLKFNLLKPNQFKLLETAYETTKITAMKKPASFFDPPTGYKPVKSEMQLLMGDDDSSEAPDMDFLKKK